MMGITGLYDEQTDAPFHRQASGLFAGHRPGARAVQVSASDPERAHKQGMGCHRFVTRVGAFFAQCVC